MTVTKYRWDQNQAAVDYDAAAPFIHPRYREVQDAVLDALSSHGAPKHVVDLGGGSGRLAERVLQCFEQTLVTVVDPSEAFLKLCEGRLGRFGDRARVVRAKAQQPLWVGVASAPGSIDAIVSTSALHHLDADEKNRVFRLCREALGARGVLINGDEYRPPSDTAYYERLVAWGEHMDSAVAVGQIPESFREVIAAWRRRNLDGFGGPRESGDDCHETVEEQTARLYGAGFRRVEPTWREDLWAVLVATA